MLLDTSAWVEYFLATEKGNKIRDLLVSGRAIFICPLTIAEISSWCHKNQKEPSELLNIIKELSVSLELSEAILVSSGRMHDTLRKNGSKISLIDCVIYQCAYIHGLELLTTDFEGLDGVLLL